MIWFCYGVRFTPVNYLFIAIICFTPVNYLFSAIIRGSRVLGVVPSTSIALSRFISVAMYPCYFIMKYSRPYIYGVAHQFFMSV